MSKYIPTDNKPKGQAKPKLKVKVVTVLVSCRFL